MLESQPNKKREYNKIDIYINIYGKKSEGELAFRNSVAQSYTVIHVTSLLAPLLPPLPSHLSLAASSSSSLESVFVKRGLTFLQFGRRENVDGWSAFGGKK